MQKRWFLLLFTVIFVSGCSFIGNENNSSSNNGVEERSIEEIQAEELDTLPTLVFLKQTEPLLSRTDVVRESYSECTLISRDDRSTWEYHAASQVPCLELGVILDGNGYLVDDRQLTPQAAQKFLLEQENITVANEPSEEPVEETSSSVPLETEPNNIDSENIYNFKLTDEVTREPVSNTIYEKYDEKTETIYLWDSNECLVEPRSEEAITQWINSKVDTEGKKIPLTREEELFIARERSKNSALTYYNNQAEQRDEDNKTNNHIFGFQFSNVQYASIEDIFLTVNRNNIPEIYDYRCLFEYNNNNRINYSQMWEWEPPQEMLLQERQQSNKAVTMTSERNAAGYDTGRKLILSHWTGVGIEDLDEVSFIETLDPYTQTITNTVDLRINYKNWVFRFSGDNILGARKDLGEEIEEEDWKQMVITQSGLIAEKRNYSQVLESRNDLSDIVRLARLEDPLIQDIKVYAFSPSVTDEEPNINDAWWASGTSATFFETGEVFWGAIANSLSQVDPRTGVQTEINELTLLNGGSANTSQVTHAWVNPAWVMFRTNNTIIVMQRGDNIDKTLIDANTGINLGVPSTLTVEDPEGKVREFLQINEFNASDNQIDCLVQNRLDLEIDASVANNVISNRMLLLMYECAPENLAEISASNIALPEEITVEQIECAIEEIFSIQVQWNTLALDSSVFIQLETNIANECNMTEEQAFASIILHYEIISPQQLAAILNTFEPKYNSAIGNSELLQEIFAKA